MANEPDEGFHEGQEFADIVNEMNERVENCVKQLKNAADYADKVWCDCKLANCIGCALSIIGGITESGALLLAGVSTSLGASYVEGGVNSTLAVQVADEAVQNANLAIENVNRRIELLKTAKDETQLALLAAYVVEKFGINHKAVAYLQQLKNACSLAKLPPAKAELTTGIKLLKAVTKNGTSEIATNDAGPANLAGGVGGNVAEASAKTALSIISEVKYAFVIFHTIDFAFTVKHLLENEGCHLARTLRYKATEYESRAIRSELLLEK
ncbi:uncharacterized protein [Acropora muricata]|uniref:uncharacterized protein n=1 Tax=Acropora muricata TaxID=159855 RepID=UPI0034E59261